MGNANEKRIARNTVFLFLRMVITVFVSLYTSRVVLETLGVRDFGIFNLVAGFVTIFASLNGTMSAATMRFLNFEMGLSNSDNQSHPLALKQTFGTSLAIHLTVALIVVILAESVGLWYVNTHLDILPERMLAANWVYQFAILSSVITIAQIPFTAEIMAHEQMDAYAYIELAHTFLKLAIVLILLWIPSADNLIFYAFLFFVVTLLVGLAYLIYSIRKFPECKGKPTASRNILHKMIRYSAWDLFGNVASTVRMQGTNVIINNFGGTVLNAAAGLALQVTTTLQKFAITIISAFRPQIVQQYAQSDFATMQRLIINAGMFCALMILTMIGPFIIEMPYVLKLWLAEVPDHTVIFTRLCLIASVGELLKSVVDIGIHATGRLMRLSFISGTMLLIELPAMYFLINYTQSPAVVYLIHAVWIFAIVLADSLILRYQVHQFNIGRFWWNAIIKPILVFIPTIAAIYAIHLCMHQSFWRFCLCGAASAIILPTLAYTTCLNKQTRALVKTTVLSKLHRNKPHDA